MDGPQGGRGRDHQNRSIGPRVLVSVPNTGWIHKHCAFALLKIIQDSRVRANIILPTHSPDTNNRHQIVNDFINGEYSYLVSFDADNPPRNNPIDLVFLDKDVIGCPTPVWHNTGDGTPFYWNAMDAVEGGYKPHRECEGLQQVDAIGAGCMVIARRVMLKVQAPFMRKWNDDGTVAGGGDFAFCERARNSGFSIWAHYGYPCYHFNEVELGEVITALRGEFSNA